MKKICLIILSFMMLASIVRSQSSVYHPFPASNAFWGIDGHNIFELRCLNIRYGLNGDTLINSKLYHKVYSLVDSTISNTASVYYAAIREEDKRIYTLIDDAPEEILYDFNAEVGDTLFWHYSLMFHAPEEFARVVTSVDSIRLNNGEYRKRFYLEPAGFNSMSDVVVEGIGSILWQGLFNPLINTIATNGDSYSMTCFKQDEVVYFLANPNCDHCFCTLLTGLPPVISSTGYSVSPNPAHKMFTLISPLKLNDFDVILFNAYGEQLKKWNSLTGNTNQLDIGEIPPGCYLLSIVKGDSKPDVIKLLIN
ncbi:MAG: T9SS type A sorting domain-containing protein [Bacteroidetes bacterium]|nr:T9SS type A sorting domain-containing protein [Bacteroidota bacterium]